MQTDLGRLASLEALQEVALGKTMPGVNDWLEAHDLISEPRLGQSLTVKSGWERAVETVLGSYLQAVCVDELDKVAGSLEKLSQGGLMLIEQGDSVRAKDLLNGRLLDYVEAPTGVTQLLKNVYVGDEGRIWEKAIKLGKKIKIDLFELMGIDEYEEFDIDPATSKNVLKDIEKAIDKKLRELKD